MRPSASARSSRSAPAPAGPGRNGWSLPYRFSLPAGPHVFLPGHWQMTQAQSSWFPLYGRNPQTVVPNICKAMPADYHKAMQGVYQASVDASYIALPVVSN